MGPKGAGQQQKQQGNKNNNPGQIGSKTQNRGLIPVPRKLWADRDTERFFLVVCGGSLRHAPMLQAV